MPIFDLRPPTYKPTKPVIEDWNTFRKGLNLLLRPTELDNQELAQADNILLTGSGVPTGRWGTAKYFVAGATGSVRGLGSYKSNDGVTNEILALTDSGYLVRKSASSYEVITGQSWPSGSFIHTEQLGGKTYIASKDVAFTEYDGTDLAVYATISAPTGLSATNFSGATGPRSVSYLVVAISPNGGQTTPSGNYVLANLPDTLSDTRIHLRWTAPSAASLSGYEIYRGRSGEETLLATIGPETTRYEDYGADASISFLPPDTNTTGGVKSRFIIKYKDRLLLVPEDDPSKLMISGRYPYHTAFNALDGGGYIYIDPDSGDNITGIAVQPIADRLVVYKERSSYLVELSAFTAGNFLILDPKYQAISTAVGCSSQDTIATVENDTFYFGRDGLYVTGYEPNFLNIIRTNEVSAKMRPYLDTLNSDDYDTACAFYVDNKYILSFPNRGEMIVYDRERGAFVGPWRFPFGVQYMRMHVDDTGTERWVLGSKTSQVYEFSQSLNSDDGETIVKTLRTKKTYFGDFSVLNIVRYFYVLLRGIVGTVTVNIILEDKNGNVSVVKSFTITGSEVAGFSGYGMNKYGDAPYGTENTTMVSVSSDELTRWGTLFKQARLIQLEVTVNTPNSNFELLGAKIEATKQRGTLSSSQRV